MNSVHFALYLFLIHQSTDSYVLLGRGHVRSTKKFSPQQLAPIIIFFFSSKVIEGGIIKALVMVGSTSCIRQVGTVDRGN